MLWGEDIAVWFITLVCLTGTVLNVRRIRWCFLLWVLGNIGWMAVDLAYGLWPRALLDMVQLALAAWGWAEWSRTE